MYQALYRKYRPRAFSEVFGQDHVTVTLKNELQNGRISHAYLFTGSRGTGKTTCALILAKAVNCLHPKEGEPCGECENCRGVDDGSLLDVMEIDAASNNGVDNIRDLREQSAYLPASAKYRVFIIDEVHMLSAGAFNALLKTLEEPPPHVIFILATTESHKLPATILSRCQRFDFRRIAPEPMAERLQQIAKAENFTLDEDAALLIARLGDGALRDAISLLDVCASREEGNRRVSEETVSAAAGLAGRSRLFSLADAVGRNAPDEVLRLVDEMYMQSCDMERLCEELIAHYRDLMLCKTLNAPENVVVCPAEELAELRRAAEGCSLASILSAMDQLELALQNMRRGGTRRVELELALLRLCRGEETIASDTVIPRPSVSIPPPGETGNAGRAKVFGPEPAGTTPVRAAPPVEARAPANPGPEKPQAPPVSSRAAEDGLTLLPQWNDILEELRGTNPLICAVLDGSDAYVRGDTLLIHAKNSQFRDLVKGNFRHRDDIRAAARRVTGREFRLGPYTPPEETGTSASPGPLERLEEKLRAAGFETKP